MKRIRITMLLITVVCLFGRTARAQTDSCRATTPIRSAIVDLDVPKDQTVSGLAVLIKYPTQAVALPSTGGDHAVTERVKGRPDKAIVAAHVNAGTVRVVLARSEVFPTGQLFSIDFDSCQGSSAPAAGDFACSVEGCANQYGAVDGCNCTVRVP